MYRGKEPPYTLTNNLKIAFITSIETLFSFKNIFDTHKITVDILKKLLND